MEFNTPYSIPTTHSSSYIHPHPSYFSQPYTPSLSKPSDSYGVLDSSETIDALSTEFELDKQQSPIDLFMGRKKRFAAKSVQEILELIYERQDIKLTMEQGIDNDRCNLGTQLLEIGDWQTGANSQLDKTRNQIERNIMALDQEKRREETACWRDVIRLKGELREAMREFDQEHHKSNLISLPWKSEKFAGN